MGRLISIRFGPNRIRIGVVISTVAVMTAVAAPAQAGNYCGTPVGPIAPDTWCGYSAGYVYVTYNRAEYLGSGTVRVGIRQEWTELNYVNRKFDYNRVATNSSNIWSNPQVANASSSSHTIHGWWDGSSSLASAMTVSTDPDGANSEKSRQKRSMAVLRAARRDSDRLPATIATDPNGTELGWKPDEARLAFRTGKGDAYYVIPGSEVCIYRYSAAEASTGGCNELDLVNRGYSMLMEDRTRDLSPGQMRVFGLVPDGVTKVSFQPEPEAQFIEAKVRNNVYLVEAPGDASREPVVIRFHRRGVIETMESGRGL